MAGLLHAAKLASCQVALPITHLAAVNPNLHHILEQGGAAGSEGSWAMPRQSGAFPSPHRGSAQVAERTVCGVSAFAFQGSNAHVLLASDGQAAANTEVGRHVSRFPAPMPWPPHQNQTAATPCRSRRLLWVPVI